MSEEQEGGMSSVKKTVLGVLGTAVTGVGIWATTHINSLLGIEDEEETKTEQVTPAPAPVIVNLENNNTQQQNNSGGGTTIIKETVREVPAQAAAPAPAAAPVEEKKETPAERMARLKKQREEQNAGK